MTVWCAHRQQAEPTARKWLGAINTPQPPHSWASKFSELLIQYKSKVNHSKTYSKHSIHSKFPKSTLVLRDLREDHLCSFALLLLGLAFSFFLSYSQEICKRSKRHLSVWWSLQGLSDPGD
jgi:Ca2+-dependent lipid-binding protein